MTEPGARRALRSWECPNRQKGWRPAPRPTKGRPSAALPVGVLEAAGPSRRLRARRAPRPRVRTAHPSPARAEDSRKARTGWRATRRQARRREPVRHPTRVRALGALPTKARTARRVATTAPASPTSGRYPWTAPGEEPKAAAEAPPRTERQRATASPPPAKRAIPIRRPRVGPGRADPNRRPGAVARPSSARQRPHEGPSAGPRSPRLRRSGWPERRAAPAALASFCAGGESAGRAVRRRSPPTRAGLLVRSDLACGRGPSHLAYCVAQKYATAIRDLHAASRRSRSRAAPRRHRAR